MSASRIALALIGQPDLYAALRRVAAGGVCPLSDILQALATTDPDTARRLQSVDAGLLEAVIRAGAGLPAVGTAPVLKAWLKGADAHPLFLPDPALGPTTALLTQGQRPDMPAFSDRAFDDWFRGLCVPYGLGAYGEQRTVYETDQFADAASPERRTVHLGIDVFAAVGTPVHAPMPGRVLSITYNSDPLDYGHTLILQHDHGPASFFTLYGHLGGSLPGLLAEGQAVVPGQVIAHLGDWHENGGWAAHLHFQVMSDMLRQSGNFFGVGHMSLLDIWQDILIDPNLIMRIPAEKFRA